MLVEKRTFLLILPVASCLAGGQGVQLTHPLSSG